MSNGSTANPLVAYLRIEADLAVERAKRLTSLIDVLTNDGSESPSARSSNTKVEDEDDLAPLDEFGNPKYKGKKRGRKSSTKKRRRMKDPNKPKKSQTAYTCFIQANYKIIQKDLPDLKAKEVITILAQRWADTTEEEKLIYRERAASLKEAQVEEVELKEMAVVLEEMQDNGEEMVDIATAVAEAQQENVVHNLLNKANKDDDENEKELNCVEVLKKPDHEMPPRKKVVHNLLKRVNNDDDEKEKEGLKEDQGEETEDW